MRCFARPLSGVLLGCVLLILTACGSTSENVSSEEPLGDAPASSEPFLQLADQDFPSVTGPVGSKPVVTIPDTPPPAGSAFRVLTLGTGDVVQTSDLMIAQYAGFTWDDKRVFEESWDTGEPAAFSIGVGEMILAWDEALVGVPAGSRLEMIVSPDKGFGAEGLPESEVSGTDTLVYVVDVLGRHRPNDTAVGVAVEPPPGLPLVGDGADGTPEVNIPVGASPPSALRSASLLRGEGPKVASGEVVVVQYIAMTWRGARTWTSSWQRGAAERVRLGEATLAPGAEQALVGATVGSRVLVTVPPADGFGKDGLPEADVRPDDTLVYVIDLLGAYAPVAGTGDISTEHSDDDGHGH